MVVERDRDGMCGREANIETDQLRSGFHIPLRGFHLRGNSQTNFELDFAAL